MSSVGARSGQVLSERLAEYFRGNDATALSDLSPYAACLLPILTALGWRPYSRDLIDTLPHFASHFDLVDLLNVLANLGYQSDSRRMRLGELSEGLLPVLFVTRQGHIWVVTDRDEEGVDYFDAREQRRGRSTALGLRGDGHYFTSMQGGEQHTTAGVGNWFASVFGRFRGVFQHLLAMSFLIHLVGVAVPLFILSVYDRVIGVRSTDSLIYFVAGIALALVVELVLRCLRARTLGLVAGRFDYLVGVETFKQLLMLPPVMTERAAVSTQLARIRQFDAVRDLFAGPSALAALDLPFVLLFLALMWMLAGPIVLVPLSVMALYVTLGLLLLPAMNRQVAASGAARNARHRRLMDTFTGMRELKALGAESVWRNACREDFSTAIMEGFRSARGHIIVNAGAHTLQTLAAVAVLGLGAHAVMIGEMSVGMLIAVMTLMWRILSPLQTLFLTYVKFDQVIQTVRQINQLMRLETEHHSARSTLLIPRVEGRIRFNRVSFRYTPRHDPALLGVSFTVEPGELMAVIGGNGCGKSTVLKLIIGMYHPQAGTVAIDDLDLRQFNATDLRRVIAYTPQVPGLFYGTIEQNLRMADPGATRLDLERAAARAGVLDMIHTEMPRGFDTRIGDRSTDRLPSGFVYGLCLARAYLRDTPILLLDEPSASLDREADERFMQQVRDLKGSRTIVMVTHRPSHVRLADRAVTLEGGMVADIDNAEDALSRYLRASM